MSETKYAIKQDNGDILLKPCKLVNPTTLKGYTTFSPVVLSRNGCTFTWFIDFLKETNNSDDHTTGGRKYQVSRDSGKVILKEIRDGGFVSSVGFSSEEIPIVLEEIQTILTELQ